MFLLREKFFKKGSVQMARMYKVSADTSEKEKIIGGVLTAAQGAFIGVGVLISTGLFLTMMNIMPASVAFVLAVIPGAVFGLSFAFYQVEQLSLCAYLFYKHKFEKKTDYLINTGHCQYEKHDRALF